MQNIVNYFNSVLGVIFGSSHGSPRLNLLPYDSFISELNLFFENSIDSGSFDLLRFIGEFLSSPSMIFSAFVWAWFAILTFKLLLVYPFNWLRSIIRKCRG